MNKFVYHSGPSQLIVSHELHVALQQKYEPSLRNLQNMVCLTFKTNLFLAT